MTAKAFLAWIVSSTNWGIIGPGYRATTKGGLTMHTYAINIATLH